MHYLFFKNNKMQKIKLRYIKFRNLKIVHKSLDQVKIFNKEYLKNKHKFINNEKNILYIDITNLMLPGTFGGIKRTVYELSKIFDLKKNNLKYKIIFFYFTNTYPCKLREVDFNYIKKKKYLILNHKHFIQNIIASFYF